MSYSGDALLGASRRSLANRDAESTVTQAIVDCMTVTFMHADKESHVVHVVTASQQRNTILRYEFIL